MTSQTGVLAPSLHWKMDPVHTHKIHAPPTKTNAYSYDRDWQQNHKRWAPQISWLWHQLLSDEGAGRTKCQLQISQEKDRWGKIESLRWERLVYMLQKGFFMALGNQHTWLAEIAGQGRSSIWDDNWAIEISIFSPAVTLIIWHYVELSMSGVFTLIVRVFSLWNQQQWVHFPLSTGNNPK